MKLTISVSRLELQITYGLHHRLPGEGDDGPGQGLLDEALHSLGQVVHTRVEPKLRHFHFFRRLGRHGEKNI